MKGKIKGYALGVVAAATYGMNPLFALPLYARGMDANSVLFFRYLMALPILGLMVWWRGRTFKFHLRQFLPLVGLGLLMGFSSLALFESYKHMEASIASTLLFVYPLMVAVLMAVFFKERFSASTALCLATAMAGICLLYNGKPGQTLSTIGTIWVFISSLTYAIYLIFIDRSSIKGMPTIQKTFYITLFGWLVFIVKALYSGSIIIPHSTLMWADVIGLSLFPTAISLILTTLAIREIGSTPTAILGVFEPATALIFGVVIFGETLSGRDVAGLILIVAAVLMVISQGSLPAILTSVKRLFPRLPRR